MHHREQKVYAVTSPVRCDVCVHETGAEPPAPAELQVYPQRLAPESEVHDREASGVALEREAVEAHVVAMAGVPVGYLQVVKVAGTRNVEVGLRKSIQLVALAAATYAATWSVGDDAAVVHAEGERAATAVVVSRVQTPG